VGTRGATLCSRTVANSYRQPLYWNVSGHEGGRSGDFVIVCTYAVVQARNKKCASTFFRDTALLHEFAHLLLENIVFFSTLTKRETYIQGNWYN
jgi:hypothetical protein